MTSSKSSLVLLISREEHTLIQFKAIFEPLGYQIVSTSNVEAVVNLLDSLKPTLIIIDIMNPEFDSLHILKTIRGYSSMPIVILAEQNDTTTCVKALSIGADDCIMKPFRNKEILSRIEAKLRRTSD